MNRTQYSPLSRIILLCTNLLKMEIFSTTKKDLCGYFFFFFLRNERAVSNFHKQIIIGDFWVLSKQ